MEILITHDMSLKGQRMLHALADTAPIPCTIVDKPAGKGDPLLMTYGVGHPERLKQTEAHRKAGGTVVMWDIGYFGRGKDTEKALRLSVNDWHPQRLLDRVPLDGSRWDSYGITLREDFNAKGPIILVGLGPKTRAIIADTNWEAIALTRLRRRFPRARIIYRPKPRRIYPPLPVPTDARTPIEELLQGASLVVCRHSNVAVDAAIAGVPFEASDGAAKWLDGKPYTRENRLEFLRRLAWFNWRPDEAAQAWKVIQRCV